MLRDFSKKYPKMTDRRAGPWSEAPNKKQKQYLDKYAQERVLSNFRAQA